MTMPRKQRGFTLIELLVVISIIGLLASVVLVGLNGARIKTRDLQRIATLHEIRSAIELYNTANGHYPVAVVGSPATPTWAAFDPANAYYNNQVVNPAPPPPGNITAALAPYIKVPLDPSAPSIYVDAGYLYLSDGTDYKLMSWRSPENMNNYNTSVIDYSRCGNTVLSNGQCVYDLQNTVGYWTTGAKDW